MMTPYERAMLEQAQRQTDLLVSIEALLQDLRRNSEWAWNGHPMPVRVETGRIG